MQILTPWGRLSAIWAMLALAGCTPATDAADGGTGDDGGGSKKGGAPWITSAPNHRYFMFEDGGSFFPLGTATSGDQLSQDYFGTITEKNKSLTFDPNTLEKRFADMQANGENFLRIDIEGLGWRSTQDTQRLLDSGAIQFLEDPAGTFNEEYARRIDKVFELAERYGIYLEMVLIAHTCHLEGLDGKLDMYSYHVSQGGPLHTLADLFSDTQAKSLWKKRLEYIARRWGKSSHVFIWELYNALGFCGGSGSNAIDGAWVAEMGEFLRQTERSLYGRAHLVAVSSPGFTPHAQFFVTVHGPYGHDHMFFQCAFPGERDLYG